MFEPVRKIQKANYFEEIIENGKKKYKAVDDKMAGKQGVKKMSLNDLSQDQLYIPEVTMVIKKFLIKFKFCYFRKMFCYL